MAQEHNENIILYLKIADVFSTAKFKNKKNGYWKNLKPQFFTNNM